MESKARSVQQQTDRLLELNTRLCLILMPKQGLVLCKHVNQPLVLVDKRLIHLSLQIILNISLLCNKDYMQDKQH